MTLPNEPVLIPTVGPLTSTEGLLPGDVLRRIADGYELRKDDICVVKSIVSESSIAIKDENTLERIFRHIPNFAFVGRPDSEGWIPWDGGENPVPGCCVHVHQRSGASSVGFTSETFDWCRQDTPKPTDIVRFAVLPATVKTTAYANHLVTTLSGSVASASPTFVIKDRYHQAADRVREAHKQFLAAIDQAKEVGLTVRCEGTTSDYTPTVPVITQVV